MQGFEVTLRADGLFEAPSTLPGHSSVRIIHEPSECGLPWVTLVQDDMGIKWTRNEAFNSLDDAIDFAVEVARGNDDGPGAYRVRLPDGLQISRPGRKSIEEVMAAAGWVYVTTLVGYSMHKTERGATPFQAISAARQTVAGTSVVLGEVNLSDSDEEGDHWCADLNLEYGGFARFEEIEKICQAGFRNEGIDVIPIYDYRTRTSVVGKSATILQFPMEKAAKSAA